MSPGGQPKLQALFVQWPGGGSFDLDPRPITQIGSEHPSDLRTEASMAAREPDQQVLCHRTSPHRSAACCGAQKPCRHEGARIASRLDRCRISISRIACWGSSCCASGSASAVTALCTADAD